MKKIVFVVVTALALISVGSVFANGGVTGDNANTTPSDTTATCCEAPVDTVAAD